MNRPGIALSALVAATLLASVGLPDATVDARGRDHRLEDYRVRAERYEAAYNELLQALDRVDDLNGRRRTRGVQKRIRGTIDDARRRAAALLDDRAFDRPAAVTVIAPAVEPTTVYYETAEAMTPADFRGLRAAVADASFAKDRLRIVEAAAEHNWFTADQVVELVRAATFADTRVEIGALLYPRVIDLRDWYKVYDALDFQASRDKLRKRVQALDAQRAH